MCVCVCVCVCEGGGGGGQLLTGCHSPIGCLTGLIRAKKSILISSVMFIECFSLLMKRASVKRSLVSSVEEAVILIYSNNVSHFCLAWCLLMKCL